MNTLYTVLQILPVQNLTPDIILVLLPASLVVLAALVIPSWLWISRKRFVRALEKVAENPINAKEWFHDRFERKYILKRSDLIEKFAEEHDRKIVSLTGVDELWIGELKLHGKKKDFQRVIRYAPERGLFPCFLTALQREELAGELTGWLKSEGEFLPLRKLGLATNGEDFDGEAALKILFDRVDQLRELAGDPEWTVRHFALNTLIYDSQSTRSKAIIEESLNDPRPEIREFAMKRTRESDYTGLYEALEKAFLTDPVFDVRSTAIERIRKEFGDRLTLDPEKLKKEEVLHVLELLRIDNPADESIALHFLDNDNLEYRLPAAHYLAQAGVLKRLALEIHPGDEEAIARSHRLLKKAIEVEETSFFSILEETGNPATLILCGRLLLESENRSDAITNLAKKTFGLPREGKNFVDIYEITLRCIQERGNSNSYYLYNKELSARKNDPQLIELLLEHFSPESAEIVKKTILDMIYDENFTATEKLEHAASGFPRPLIIPDILKILKSKRGSVAQEVRKRALRILGRFQIPYSLQVVIEQLPSLETEDAREFVEILSGFPEDELNHWIQYYLNGSDSPLRAALILALPALETHKHTREIKKALKDSDPDVRIAAVYSLVALKESEVLDQQSPVLRDPVERVRMESAKILGAHASEKVIHTFGEIIDDDDEALSVKTAAIRGLAHSPHKTSIELLIRSLNREGQDPQFKTELLEALSKKTEKHQVKFILEKFKDATPRLRQDLTQAFHFMGDAGAGAMMDLMEEDIPSLKPFIVEVLENTGTVEANIRKLRHRDPSRRKEAASFLSAVGSRSSFRGLVMAAQDPDEDVRILVIRALESLETEDGKKLLEDLQKDPDRRVRRYTHWAMERLKAKSK